MRKRMNREIEDLSDKYANVCIFYTSFAVFWKRKKCSQNFWKETYHVQGHRWFLMTLAILMTMLSPIAFVHTARTAKSANISYADVAMYAYIAAFYDPKAKYFYYDTTRTQYNDFWKEAISWDIVMDAYQRNPVNRMYRQMIDDVYDGFMARNQ